MGYDMYVVDEAGQTVPRDVVDPNYWRRNLSGGYWQAKKFEELGLGTWCEEFRYEQAEEWGFPDPPENLEFDEDTETYTGEGAQAYNVLLQEYLKDRRGSGLGIALYKLTGSNDGWWVTKEECEEFLTLWEAAGQPEVDRFRDDYIANDTIPFIRSAAAYSGFRVY